MSIPSASLPIVGNPDSTEEPKVRDALDELQQILTRALDSSNFAASLNALIGLSDTTSTRRGKATIATQESSSGASYGFLTTPDKVASIVLPTDGLIAVSYRATWQSSVAGAGRAAIFVGTTQVKNAGFPAPFFNEVTTPGGIGWAPLASCTAGLVSDNNGSSSTYAGDSLPQIVGAVLNGTAGFLGGLCVIEAAAGTYDVGVKFNATSGSVTAKDRRLKVLTIGF